MSNTQNNRRAWVETFMPKVEDAIKKCRLYTTRGSIGDNISFIGEVAVLLNSCKNQVQILCEELDLEKKEKTCGCNCRKEENIESQ